MHETSTASKTIKITEANPNDALDLTRLYHITWLDTYPNDELGITKEDIEDSYKDSYSEEKINNYKKIIRDAPKNQKRLVAKCGDKIVGVISVEIEEKINMLKTIYILPEFQGKGIGTTLWNKIKDFLDQDKDTVVHVVTYNENAIRFYKKIGFVDFGKRWSDDKWKMKSGATLPEMELVIKKPNHI